MCENHLYQRPLFFVSWCLLLLLAACSSSTSTAPGAPNPAARESTPTSPPATDQGILYSNKDHTDKVHGIAWSPDGKYIASGSDDHTVQVIDAARWKPNSLMIGCLIIAKIGKDYSRLKKYKVRLLSVNLF